MLMTARADTVYRGHLYKYSSCKGMGGTSRVGLGVFSIFLGTSEFKIH